MTHWIVLDFETASACDLKKSGADVYAEHPTTEVLCIAWETDAGGRELWHPGLPIPDALLDLAEDPAYIFVAHNVRFERAIWQKIMVEQFGWPELPAERWADTLAKCAMLTLDQKLEMVLTQLRIPQVKDTEGTKAVLTLSRTDRKGNYPERTPELMERIYAYNLRDIDSQVALHKRIGWLPPGEREVWLLDQTINDRGVRLDLDFVRAAQSVVDKTIGPLSQKFAELTGGLKMTQLAKVQSWALAKGVSIPDMQKETLVAMLGEDVDSSEEDLADLLSDIGVYSGSLPDDVREALHIRQLIGSAAIKKLVRMEHCVCADGRARGLLQYHGAGPGRWAGRLLQPQNFPRGTLTGIKTDEDRQGLIDAILTGNPDHVQSVSGSPPVETIVSSLRYAISASAGHQLVAGDFASIEARVCLALAGQWDKVSLLASGADVYCDMAEQIYGRPITKADAAERHVGKGAVLGLGFQMGAAKFFLRGCPDQSLEFAQTVVKAYRESWAPEVPKLWRGLNNAATRTVHSGLAHEDYGVLYEKCDLWLTARLPSGRKLWYFNPQPTFEAMPWDATDIRPGFTYEAKKNNVRKRVKAFGGLLTENVVQGLARDLLVDAMFRVEKEIGLPIILTAHDELLIEPRSSRANYKELEEIMSERSDWAKALNIPVATEGWMGSRYRK